jgi:hypothetical protein
MGALLGDPNDSIGQRALVQSALSMLGDATVLPGEIRIYQPSGNP